MAIGRAETPSLASFMCKTSYSGRRASRGTGWPCAMLAIISAMAASPSFATCLVSKDPAIRELQTLVDKDAARVLKRVATRLQSLEHAPLPDVQLLASLYAVQAQAYSILQLDDDAKTAAWKGLALAARGRHAVRVV